VTKQILEAEEKREAEAPFFRFFDHIHNIELRSFHLDRPDGDVAGRIDTEVVSPPAVDVISFQGLGNVPRRRVHAHVCGTIRSAAIFAMRRARIPQEFAAPLALSGIAG
jgi:hypothetical protein